QASVLYGTPEAIAEQSLASIADCGAGHLFPFGLEISTFVKVMLTVFMRVCACVCVCVCVRGSVRLSGSCWCVFVCVCACLCGWVGRLWKNGREKERERDRRTALKRESERDEKDDYNYRERNESMMLL